MSRTIVLVEDHAPVRELYAEALTRAEWRVIERPSAMGLLTLIRHENAEAVVIDWTLPGKSGLEALQAIKADKATRHVRVIVLTAHSASSLREQALAAGAELFLEKPLRPDVLLRALDPCYSAAHDAGTVGSV
ncbi:MAG: phosphate regulon transcriptional regulatory protein PhoB [Myxococcales bacterium]|nr:phosphate regulon transcriptional regulatory protein PhoB [Myxococcales bacterium]